MKFSQVSLIETFLIISSLITIGHGQITLDSSMFPEGPMPGIELGFPIDVINKAKETLVPQFIESLINQTIPSISFSKTFLEFLTFAGNLTQMEITTLNINPELVFIGYTSPNIITLSIKNGTLNFSCGYEVELTALDHFNGEANIEWTSLDIDLVMEIGRNNNSLALNITSISINTPNIYIDLGKGFQNTILGFLMNVCMKFLESPITDITKDTINKVINTMLSDWDYQIPLQKGNLILDLSIVSDPFISNNNDSLFVGFGGAFYRQGQIPTIFNFTNNFTLNFDDENIQGYVHQEVINSLILQYLIENTINVSIDDANFSNYLGIHFNTDTLNGVLPGLKGINPPQDIIINIISGIDPAPSVSFISGIIEANVTLQVGLILPEQNNTEYLRGNISANVIAEPIPLNGSIRLYITQFTLSGLDVDPIYANLIDSEQLTDFIPIAGQIGIDYANDQLSEYILTLPSVLWIKKIQPEITVMSDYMLLDLDCEFDVEEYISKVEKKIHKYFNSSGDTEQIKICWDQLNFAF